MILNYICWIIYFFISVVTNKARKCFFQLRMFNLTTSLCLKVHCFERSGCSFLKKITFIYKFSTSERLKYNLENSAFICF